jgi:hypothetical protein
MDFGISQSPKKFGFFGLSVYNCLAYGFDVKIGDLVLELSSISKYLYISILYRMLVYLNTWNMP